MSEQGGQLEALRMAWDDVSSRPPRILAENSGAALLDDGTTLRLRMLDRDYDIALSRRSIAHSDREREEVPTHLQVLILHYLAGSGNVQVSNRLATFRDFDGGAVYYPAFKARAIDPLARSFGSTPAILGHIGRSLKAETVDAGDMGVRLHFFPKVPVTVVLWRGDDEVEASANMLFDAHAGRILPTEDISVLGGVLTRHLIRIARGHPSP